MQPTQSEFIAQATQSVQQFLDETNPGTYQQNQNLNVSRNIDHLKDMVNSLAEETRTKARMYEQQNQRSQTPSRRGRSVVHQHATNDCDLIKKWSTPNVSNTKLLTGGSACFKHLPGAQYCVEAGLHHHHHHVHNVSKRMPPSSSFDASWFADMERRLKALAHELEKERNACCPDDKAGQLYQIRFAVLSRHLEEMNALQQEKLRQDRERQHASEREWEQRARELAELYAKMLQDDRAQWRRVVEKVQETYLHDLQALRNHYEVLLADERARMQAEIDQLRRLLAERQPTVACGHGDLISELQRQIAAQQAEIERLRHELAQSRLKIEIKEGEVKPVVRQRFPTTASGESVWASGPINKSRLGQKNPFPERVVPEVTPAVVRVRDVSGAEADPSKYQFVKLAGQ